MAAKQGLTIEAARKRAAMPVEVALTLDVPHAWNVAHGDKRAENRSWECGKPHEGRRIAIHASMRRPTDDDARLDIEACGAEPPECTAMDAGAIVATARVVGFARVEAGRSGRGVQVYAAMPDVTEERCWELVMQRAGSWAHGPIVWILDDVRRLHVAIAAKGAQRLWRLPPKLAAAVNEAKWTRAEP